MCFFCFVLVLLYNVNVFLPSLVSHMSQRHCAMGLSVICDYGTFIVLTCF